MKPPSPLQNQSSAPQFAQHRVADQQHQGLVVYAFAHPHEWQARSQVVWNFQHTSLPVAVYAAAWNPQGMESFEFLPVEAFFWLEPNYGFVAVGQNSKGLTCMQPLSAADAMMQLIIPKYRGNRQNLHVTGVQQIPNLPQILNAPELQQGPTQGVLVRVEYEEQGRAFEEEFCGVLSWNQAQGGASVQTNWGFARLFCFRAARGRLDAMRQTFWQIAGSVQPNPQWLQIYEQVTQQLNGQFQQHTQAMADKLEGEKRLSQQIIAHNEQLNAQRSQNIAWSVEQQQRQNEQRSQTNYTAQDALNDTIAGREAFQDPNSSAGNYHYQYGHDKYVWTDSQGQFQSSNDPTFDPNTGSDRNWVRARRVRGDD
jgi:hypothetical protein